jgi:hypothetical protein
MGIIRQESSQYKKPWEQDTYNAYYKLKFQNFQQSADILLILYKLIKYAYNMNNIYCSDVTYMCGVPLSVPVSEWLQLA